jgi:hypothetical protein
MGKVSIGLRGWRFDEEALFTDEGELRPIDDLPRETRDRLVRLTVLVGSPCDACWLVHGDENLADCDVANVVYGEPLHEVVLCPEHEPDLLYWYRKAGGSDHRGEPEFQDAFYEWFEDGGRAPEGYGGLEHVETDPDGVPDPDPDTEMPSIEDEVAELDGEELDALDVDLDDLDL